MKRRQKMVNISLNDNEMYPLHIQESAFDSAENSSLYPLRLSLTCVSHLSGDMQNSSSWTVTFCKDEG